MEKIGSTNKQTTIGVMIYITIKEDFTDNIGELSQQINAKIGLLQLTKMERENSKDKLKRGKIQRITNK